MNAVEIEEAVSRLAEAPFDPEEFPLAFLAAFGNKPTTLKRLKSKSGGSNQSDLPGGVLQRNNIHLKVCPEGEVTSTLSVLRDSPATVQYKAKFILATDGKSFEAENLADGETIACDYPNFPDHFGFFLALAGITTVKQIRENAFDINAKFQCDVLYLGQQEARLLFLPLERDNWITCGNALRLDWLSLCSPTGTGVKLVADDLFSTPLEQVEIDFENEGGETYICGNPPYRGSQWQTEDQKSDLREIFEGRTKNWGSLDYVSGWFMKAADYGIYTKSTAAFVSTNSICQGRIVYKDDQPADITEKV